jgi:SacI restriction endonuclease
LKIDKEAAKALVHEQAKREDAPSDWIAKVRELSRLCDEGISKTHLAFLATAMLAKASDRRADLFAIKPQHAKNAEGTFSARVLCHSVLVPLSAEIGFSLGVTGREPLNNQPYFRMMRLDDGTPVHPGGRVAFDYMLGLVRELGDSTEEQAAGALAAFITVRREYQPNYADHDSAASVPPWELSSLVAGFVAEASENGRRAQAVAAGLMDVVYGADRVESGRINDPSRRHPGDVCVADSEGEGWQKAMEVRDKPVAASDIQIFGKKCLDLGVRDAALLMVSDRQTVMDATALQGWAQGFGLGLTLFTGWQGYVEQVLYWSPMPKPEAAKVAVGAIHRRLVEVEVAEASVIRWQELVAGTIGGQG